MNAINRPKMIFCFIIFVSWLVDLLAGPLVVRFIG